MLVYGARSNPLSHFLTRSLNKKVNAQNVFVADSAETGAADRLPTMRQSLNCNEFPTVTNRAMLKSLIEENGIGGIIDVTGGRFGDEILSEQDFKSEHPQI